MINFYFGEIGRMDRSVQGMQKGDFIVRKKASINYVAKQDLSWKTKELGLLASP